MQLELYTYKSNDGTRGLVSLRDKKTKGIVAEMFYSKAHYIKTEARAVEYMEVMFEALKKHIESSQSQN